MATSVAGWVRENRWHYRRSLASRVALLTAVAVGAALLVMIGATFLTLRHQVLSSLDDSLMDRAVKASKDSTLAAMTSAQYPPWVMGAADVRVAYVTADGRVVTAVRDEPRIVLGAGPELAVAQGDRNRSLRTVVAEDGTRYRVAAVRSGSDSALVLAQSLDPVDSTLGRLSLVMLLFVGISILSAGLAGWTVASNGLRPVRRLTTQAERVAETEDLTPLRVEGDDEVARLARSFNQMLAAVSASRDRQRQLVADAGHELRTPLTALRTNVDLLSQAGDGIPEEARREVLDDIRAQTEELSTLVGDLVELARDEPLTHAVQTLELADIVERALARVRLRSHGVEFDVDLDGWRVLGEATSLERAAINLLDNAVKWSPPGGRVEVRLSGGVLTVCDQGPGIAEADLPHVFERFYRSADSRTMPGSGLGLSIVRQVALRHGGSVEADNVPGAGARLSLRLPAAPHFVVHWQPATPK